MSEKIISYKKLWKLLIDKNMNKRDLKLVSGVSTEKSDDDNKD